MTNPDHLIADGDLPAEPPAETTTFTMEIEPPEWFGAPIGRVCANCNLRAASLWWVGEGSTLALAHGMASPWCERCSLEAQLKHCREQAARLPELELRLARLDFLDVLHHRSLIGR